jgi:hypothetical protein
LKMLQRQQTSQHGSSWQLAAGDCLLLQPYYSCRHKAAPCLLKFRLSVAAL